ncbi:uncharacterized protein CLUP02_02571 [Colletotrichum lupini]|uniref:Uncharacterized protein n=1 Tax=Colletotrichum lupini TaxID=145971 RepID=A0A9Q8SGS2_9PEZI|nr:uncharacterized protein CLUP02_02571 [Colletotrichum lupini]UQC77104.1 hypothetical protein CLUP02_02571 [Colletotrichum lupini]
MPPWLIPDSMGCQVEVAERLSESCSNDIWFNHSHVREILTINNGHRHTRMAQWDEQSTNLSVHRNSTGGSAMRYDRRRTHNGLLAKEAQRAVPPSLRIISHPNFSLPFPPTTQRLVPYQPFERKFRCSAKKRGNGRGPPLQVHVIRPQVPAPAAAPGSFATVLHSYKARYEVHNASVQHAACIFPRPLIQVRSAVKAERVLEFPGMPSSFIASWMNLANPSVSRKSRRSSKIFNGSTWVRIAAETSSQHPGATDTLGERNPIWPNNPTAQRHPGASWLRFTAPGMNGASAAFAAAAAADQPVDAYSDLGPELKLIYTIRTGIPSSIL